MNHAQLNRIEDQVRSLRSELALKEQLNRIEAELISIAEDIGTQQGEKLKALTDRLNATSAELANAGEDAAK